MSSTLLLALVISLTLNGIFFAIAYRLKTDKLTDITYSLSFIFIGLFAYSRSSHKSFETIGTALILIWSLRLGGFLLYRVIKNGKDRRFDGMRESFTRFAKFWVGQAVVAWVLMVPAILAFSGSKDLSVISIVGVIIWLIGLIFESMADFQKYKFRLEPKNKDKWIGSGVWSLSRHPNYFGEMLIWVGVYLYTFPVLNSMVRVLCLISPVLIIVLLRYGSGIPILEKSADKRWGDNTKYIEYKRKTNLLIPSFKKHNLGKI